MGQKKESKKDKKQYVSTVGRPLKYDNAEDLQKEIDNYFKYASDNEEIPTVTGLAWWLGLSRNGLLHYEKAEENGWLKSLDDSAKHEIVNTVKRAKQYIETRYEQALFMNGKTIGAIFTLKNNYSWADKKEIEQTNKTITVGLED